MKSIRAILGLVATLLVFAGPVLGDDATAEKPADVISQVKQSANDAQQLNKALGDVFQRVAGLMNSDPDAADELLGALESTLSELEPDNADAKQLVSRGNSYIRLYRQQTQLARTSVEELIAKLKANADDTESLNLLTQKYQQQISSVARSEPSEAEQQLQAAREFLTSLKSETAEVSTGRTIDQAITSLSRLDRTIESAQKLAAMIGKEAAPIKAAAWVNGEPLAEGDLKGKVVLLDFWAVWCGPCIATFPHLREWHEKYADKGLEIIGVTNYYSYTWDDEAGRAKRAPEVSHEDEQAMLVKFAHQYDLHHRFAVMADNQLSQYYGVTGIPHVVVIDDSGIIRLVRVGSGDQNAQDIEQMLEKLLADKQS